MHVLIDGQEATVVRENLDGSEYFVRFWDSLKEKWVDKADCKPFTSPKEYIQANGK